MFAASKLQIMKRATLTSSKPQFPAIILNRNVTTLPDICIVATRYLNKKFNSLNKIQTLKIQNNGSSKSTLHPID